MTKFDWKAMVGKVAPTIAAGLGGPMAGMATKAIASALGLEAGKDPNVLETEIEGRLANASHEDLVALKNADNDFKVRMRGLGIKETDLYLQDVQQARDKFASSWEPRMVFIALGLMTSLGLWYLMTYIRDIDATKLNIVLPLFGIVVAKFIDSCSYFVGSSKGSSQKTEMLSLQANRTRV